MSGLAIAAHTALSVALICCYTIVTLTNHDGSPVLGVLGAYLGVVGVAHVISGHNPPNGSK